MRELLLGAADWWLGTAIGGGLVLLAGCGLMRLARQPAARQRLGEYAVLAALIVAGLRLLPAWLPLPWAPAAETPAAEAAAPLEFTWVAIAEQAGPTDWAAVPASDPVTETAAPLGWTWHDAFAGLMAGYLVVASVLAGRWLLGQWALNRLLRQARPAAPRVRRLFKAMAADTLWMAPRLWRRTHLRVARRLRAPVCFGLRRPAVLLPEPMDGAAEAQLRWVFAHELTHLRRRDPWSSWGIGLAQAVFFFLPQFWWVRRQVRLCQEYVADAAAAKAGAAPDEYAEFLVSLARGSAPPLGATGLGSSSDLLRRVQMLLQSSTRVQGSWPRSRSLLAAGGMLAVAVLAGGVGLRAEPPKDEKKTEERKNVIVTVRDGVVTERDALTDGEPVRVFVRRLDDREDNNGDSDGKPADKKTEKKTAKMVIVVDTGSGPVTIPIDGASEDMPKAIEKAMKKAHEQIAAAQNKRSQSTEKALELLKGELTEEQLKQLQRHIEALRAQKGAAGAERAIAEKARAAAGKALEDARGQLEKAEGEVKRRQVFVSPEGFGGAMKMDGVHAGMMGLAHGGSRLGVFIKKPSAELADQLDLPKDRGLIVIELVKDSAAAKAGLKVNDIILELAGKPVPSDPGAFVGIVRELKTDEVVAAIVLRKGHKEKIAVTVPEAKKEGAGMTWKAIGPDHPLKFEGKFDFTPEVKPDGKVNFTWQVIPKTAPPKAEIEDGETPKAHKVEKSVNRTVSIQVSDGKFVAEQKDDGVTISVTGTVNDGKVGAEKITIDDGETKKNYKRVDDVPEAHRKAVKKLISNALEPLNRFHSPPEEK